MNYPTESRGVELGELTSHRVGDEGTEGEEGVLDSNSEEQPLTASQPT